jgi:hypothetical protein
MKYGGKMLVSMMGGLAFCTTANAVTAISPETPNNPYQSIVDRNVFSLKPPPPPAEPVEVNKPQALKITLTGITTILGNKRVLMKAVPTTAKPGEAAKAEQSYILTEGQREGDLEILAIDEKLGSVKVSNAGSVQTLTFEKDGAKLPSTPAPAPAPVNGAPQIPGFPVARPFPQPPGAAAGTPNFQLPSRMPRLPGVASQGAALNVNGIGAVPLAQGSPSYTAPGFLPGNTTSPPVGNNTVSPQPSNPSLSLEEQAIMIEANRQTGGPGAALLPPTALTPRGTENTTPAQNQTPTPGFPQIPGRPFVPGPY